MLVRVSAMAQDTSMLLQTIGCFCSPTFSLFAYLASLCNKADASDRRHLLRMWLRDSEYGWDIPHALSQTKQWQRLWDLDMEEQWFPLEPVVKSERFTSQGAK